MANAPEGPCCTICGGRVIEDGRGVGVQLATEGEAQERRMRVEAILDQMSDTNPEKWREALRLSREAAQAADNAQALALLAATSDDLAEAEDSLRQALLLNNRKSCPAPIEDYQFALAYENLFISTSGDKLKRAQYFAKCMTWFTMSQDRKNSSSLAGLDLDAAGYHITSLDIYDFIDEQGLYDLAEEIADGFIGCTDMPVSLKEIHYIYKGVALCTRGRHDDAIALLKSVIELAKVEQDVELALSIQETINKLEQDFGDKNGTTQIATGPAPSGGLPMPPGVPGSTGVPLPPPASPQTARFTPAGGKRVACPHCGSGVLRSAIVCNKCKQPLEPMGATDGGPELDIWTGIVTDTSRHTNWKYNPIADMHRPQAITTIAFDNGETVYTIQVPGNAMVFPGDEIQAFMRPGRKGYTAERVVNLTRGGEIARKKLLGFI